MSGIRWKNTGHGTEFARNFCAGIGPLQLGVVLVSYVNQTLYLPNKETNKHNNQNDQNNTRGTFFLLMIFLK